MDEMCTNFRERIASARACGQVLRLRGGGSKDWYGETALGALLDTRDYAGIVAYEPTELVVTARCGTPLSELEAVLDQHGQMLAFEPPRFGGNATVGGMLACGLSGPRRPSAGAVRDFVLGASLMNGEGEILHFGGQVMKNVAGYDVARMLAGSLGTLGLILDVSLKVLPKPRQETTVGFQMTEAYALGRLQDWAALPYPITASAWEDGRLVVRLSGGEPAVRAALRKLGGEDLGPDCAYWQSLRDQTHAFFAKGYTEAEDIWRLSLPSASAALKVDGPVLIEWGGAQRWYRAAAGAGEHRALARRAGGHATLFRADDKSPGVFAALPPALAIVHRRLKTAFDPHGLFNPGRMYKEI